MKPADRRHESEISSPPAPAAMLPRSVVALTLAAAVACGAPNVDTDPLASLAHDVNPDQVVPAPLAESWRRTFEEPLTIPPVVGQRNVYLARGNELAALDAVDGAALWRLPLDSSINATPVALGQQVVVSTAGDGAETPPRIWWIADDSTILAQRQLEAAAVEIDAVAGIVVYIDGSSLGRVAGGVEWLIPLADSQTVVLSADDGLVLATVPGKMAAFDVNDGTLRWEWLTEASPLTRPAVHDGRVYVADAGGAITALHASSGAVAWRRNLGIGVASGPAVTIGLVWVAELGAQLRAFKIGNGTVAHTVPLSSRTYLDMATYEPWVIIGPVRGPWVTVRGPATPAERGRNVSRSGRTVQARVPGEVVDLELAPASGPAGVAVVNGEQELIFLQLAAGR